ncbi:hypothetical protein ACPC54_27305 [Kitasatospora sp. NPDC094028]
MTTSSARRPRRRPALDPTSAPVPAPPPRPRRGAPRCCRTWNSEHRLPSGQVVRTTWHQVACPAR